MTAFGRTAVVNGSVRFRELSVKESVPVAPGVDPVDITGMKPGSGQSGNDLEYLGPGYADTSVGFAPDGSQYYAVPGAGPQPAAGNPEQPVIVRR